MPTSKSLISNNPLRRLFIDQCVEGGDYKQLLIELLAVVHRDGGQYTQLAGFATSVEDAIARVEEMRMEITNLFNARKKKNG